MIKHIRKSLSLKIFCLTTLILLGIAAVTYGFIAAMMPMTYTDTLNRELEKQTENLIEKLSQVEFADAEGLLGEFSEQHQADLMLLDEHEQVIYKVYTAGNVAETEVAAVSIAEDTAIENDTEVSLDSIAENTGAKGDTEESTVWEGDASAEISQEESAATEDALMQGSDMVTGVIRNMQQRAMRRFSVSFPDRSEKYTLAVIGSTQMVNQAMEALEQVLPLLLLTIFLVSVLVSVFYSRYLTKPIVRLSRVSQKMAGLDFDVKCKEDREDEIGSLAGSLDELSESLGRALTELQAANCQLKDDIEKEREQERRRMAFFAAASHELKTPVTILKGQLEGMIQGVGSYKDRDKYLERSREIAESMEEMVQEILTISRMEADGFAISLKKTDLAEAIRIQLAELNELFEKKQMDMEVDLPDRVLCVCDPAMMDKVIRNVLVNAVRYSPEKARISVGLHKEKMIHSGQEGQSVLVFRVENSGVRIPEEQLHKIFDAFYRLDASRNRRSGGSGLGLYIVREILELHGAEYFMENTASGVQFTFRLFSTENT